MALSRLSRARLDALIFQIQYLSHSDRIEATRHMESFKVDFDSMTYQAMKNLKANEAVSFEKDLDRITSIKRLEPKQVKTSQ